MKQRKSANEKFNWKDVNSFLKQQGVTLISAGLDEEMDAVVAHICGGAGRTGAAAFNGRAEQK